MDLVPSKHAIEMMTSRDITWEQVLETVTNAHVTYSSRGDQMFQRDKVAVVTTRPLSNGVRLVKTVLLREVEQWSDDDARARVRRPVIRQSTPRPRPTSSPAPVPPPVYTPAPVPKPAPPRGKHLTH